jgi:hypothetical protein
MASIDLLIPELDRKLRSLHQQQSLVIKTGKTGILEQPLLPEYLRLTTTGGIVPGVEFIILDALSKHFNLYEDERDRQQILAAQADELNDSKDSDLLASIQIIQDIYPSIYSLAQAPLNLARERAINKITGLISAPVDRVATTTSQLIPPPVTQLTPPSAIVTSPQSKSGLVMGLSITCAVLFGAVVSNSFNKLPNPSTPAVSKGTQAPALNTPADSQAITSPPVQAPGTPADSQDINNPQQKGSQTSSVRKNKIITTKIAAKKQTRPSPAQAIRDHYQELNAHNYNITWNNLSSRFKSESGNSSALARKEYEEWWNLVHSIDLQRVETSGISSDGSRAVVNYRHGYTMNDGRFVQDKHTKLFLVWDKVESKWLIDRRS